MEILRFALGFLFFCGAIALLANGMSHCDDYTDYIQQEYGQHHEYHE